MKKLIVLDHMNDITYIIDYDTRAYEDAFECIDDYSEEHELRISLSNVSYMETEKVKIIAL